MRISIEGNIGAKKSYSLSLINDVYEVLLVDEPVKKWEEIGILEAFYKDKKKHAYDFQTYVFATRCEAFNEANKKIQNGTYKDMIYERDPDADKVFMKTLYETGDCDDMHYKMYGSWCNIWRQLYPIPPDITIYIESKTDKCLERILKRGRPSEKDMKIEYLDLLEKNYNEYINSLSQDNVIRLNGESDSFNENIINTIENLIGK